MVELLGNDFFFFLYGKKKPERNLHNSKLISYVQQLTINVKVKGPVPNLNLTCQSWDLPIQKLIKI